MTAKETALTGQINNYHYYCDEIKFKYLKEYNELYEIRNKNEFDLIDLEKNISRVKSN